MRSLGVIPAGKTVSRTPHGRLHCPWPRRQQGALARDETCGNPLTMQPQAHSMCAPCVATCDARVPLLRIPWQQRGRALQDCLGASWITCH